VNWFFPILLATSFSVRTPNIPAQFDYEFEFVISKPDILYIEREWEREAGREFINEEYWYKQKYKNIAIKERYYKRQVEYNQVDIRYCQPNGFTAGYALVHNSKPNHNAVIGYNKSFDVNLLIIGIDLSTDTEILFDGFKIGFSTQNEARIGLMQNLSLVLLYKHTFYERGWYQAKALIEIKLPTIGG